LVRKMEAAREACGFTVGSGEANFADDCVAWLSHTSRTYLALKLSHLGSIFVEWMTSHGIPVSDKTEMGLYCGRGMSTAPLTVYLLRTFPVEGGACPEHLEFKSSSGTIQHLGIHLDGQGTAAPQRQICIEHQREVNGKLDLLRKVLHPHKLRQLYSAFGMGKTMYGADVVWTVGKRNPQLANMERLHAQACRIINDLQANTLAATSVRAAGFRSFYCSAMAIAFRAQEVHSRTVNGHKSVLGKADEHALPIIRTYQYTPTLAADATEHLYYGYDIAHGVSRNSSAEEKEEDNSRRIDEALVAFGIEEPDFTLSTDGSCTHKGHPVLGGIQNNAGGAVLTKGLQREENEEEFEERTIERGRLKGNDLMCSYSTECLGGIAGMWLCYRNLLMLPWAQLYRRTLFWLTDSRSMLQSFDKSPYRQKSYTEMMLLFLIYILVMSGYLRVAMIFTFGHSGNPHNEAADDDAEDGDFLWKGPDGLEPDFSLWYVDQARFRHKAILHGEDDALQRFYNPDPRVVPQEEIDANPPPDCLWGEFGDDANKNPFPNPWRPRKMSHDLSAYMTRLLGQLRCGLVGRIGGHLYRVEDRCQLCGKEELGRQGASVRHLLGCERMEVSRDLLFKSIKERQGEVRNGPVAGRLMYSNLKEVKKKITSYAAFYIKLVGQVKHDALVEEVFEDHLEKATSFFSDLLGEETPVP
jgi:hypothetical protein